MKLLAKDNSIVKICLFTAALAVIFLLLGQWVLSPRSKEENIIGRVYLPSSYEKGQISQWIHYQIPEACTPSNPNPPDNVPLLIGLHGYGGSKIVDGRGVRDFLAPEANARGWLLAAPDMHGSYYTDNGSKALAWLGAQHDIIDTIEYMKTHPHSLCGVDLSRIYIAGGSMGGQIAALMAAKYPDIFAAVAVWKPFTDASVWYDELVIVKNKGILEALENETGGKPSNVPFEYQRRSPLEIAQNMRLVPIKIWHDVDDKLVQVHHSQDLKNAIDAWGPPEPPILIKIASEDLKCDETRQVQKSQHCYQPDADDVFNFLSDFTRNPHPPSSLTIRTDESKSYYWLNIVQTGGDHWTTINAAYNLIDQTVTATITDTQPLTLGLNLGSTSIVDSVGIPQEGLGLPLITYQITEEGDETYIYLQNYSSGYFTVTLKNTGQIDLTIAPVSGDGKSD